jgi:hypothetical protein
MSESRSRGQRAFAAGVTVPRPAPNELVTYRGIIESGATFYYRARRNSAVAAYYGDEIIGEIQPVPGVPPWSPRYLGVTLSAFQPKRRK